MATSSREAASMSGGYRPIGAVAIEPDAGEMVAGARTWRFAAADGMRAEVALLAADLARVRLLPAGHEPAHSWAVARTDWPRVSVEEQRSADASLTLSTEAMRVEIATTPFRVAFRWPDGISFAEDDQALGMGVVSALSPLDIPDVSQPAGSVRCHKRLAQGERILGAGERTSPLDKRGEHLIFWNTDPPQPYGDRTGAMYASIPFWLGQCVGRTYGIFLDSVWRTDLDAGASHLDQLSFGAAGGDLTYYVFAGPTPAAVLARYADLTGHMPLPPRWALGYGQSRWSYFPEIHVREVAAQFRQRQIPCDTLWLDIDYMDGYRVFTWHPRRFPDPEELVRDLGEQGFKVVTIIDPGVKADLTDPTYAEGLARDFFLRRPDGNLFTGVIWPGESVFPDFSRAEVREWWGERHRSLLDTGVVGIWDDMNEPSLTDHLVPGAGTPQGTTLPLVVRHLAGGEDGPPLAHEAFHNAYGMEMARATYEGQVRLRPERRPFVLTRSAYAGIQRYAALWTGDNQSQWEQLRLASRMCLSLGLSGVPFVGFDTGGFWQEASGELLVRFTQLGSLFPFFRNHSAMRTGAQEPWVFGQPYEAICREAIELRYRLLPYIYTLFAEAARTGAPIARALAYAFPEDDTLANVDDELLLGESLLAAPVVEENQPMRVAIFPPGAWVDWWTGERVAGPLRRRVESPLDVLPLYAREGAIIPMGPVMQYVGERAEAPLTLACYLGPEATARAAGTVYEDDGESPAYIEGTWRLTRFAAERAGERITVRAETPEGAYRREACEWIVELHLPRGTDGRPALASARLNGQSLSGPWEIIPRRYETLAQITLSRVAPPFTLEVTLV